MTRNIKTAGSKKEKKQQKEESNLIATWSPNIEQISIIMKYAQTGALEPLMRTVNFTPDSMASFKISCLCSDCPESTFDFTDLLGSMIKSHKTSSKGKISCENCASPECSNVLYTITIKYKR
jgi:hypothetical protein